MKNNYRILCVDSEDAILKEYEKILSGGGEKYSADAQAREAKGLFPENNLSFEPVFVKNGEEAIILVEKQKKWGGGFLGRIFRYAYVRGD